MATFKDIQDNGRWFAGNVYTFKLKGVSISTILQSFEIPPLIYEYRRDIDRWLHTEGSVVLWDSKDNPVISVSLDNIEEVKGDAGWYLATVTIPSGIPKGKYYLKYISIFFEGWYVYGFE